MKQGNSLIPSVADPDNLRLAFWKASKGKRHTHQVLSYQAHLEDNLVLLRAQILRGLTEVGNYRYFKIFEPKERQICASAFGEQVLHHALMNVCHPYFERQLLDCSYASRKGKGTYAAIAQAQKYTKHYDYFLKLDVKKFFDSIEHSVLKAQLSRMFKDETLLAIFQQIIDSYATQPNRGLPIGNLTSQYFANQYLSPLDHHIKEHLKGRAYVRYMDDMVIWHNDKEVLKSIKNEINLFLENNLLCQLKPEILNTTQDGLPFLGYLILPNTMKLLQGSKRRFIRKAKNVEDKYHTGEWDEATCQAHILPLLAFAKHADTEGLREKIFYGR
jgi:RNA-directed DNA polymerase